MNDKRFKELMDGLVMPQSRSILQALKQVANEVAQEVHAEYGRENWADSPSPVWRIPESHAIVCPSCGWIGRKQELRDHECPDCGYSYGNFDLLTLEAILTNEELWDDVAIGPFALSVCRVLRITDMLDLVNKVKESSETSNFTFADLRILQVQACQILRKIKEGK